MIGRWIARLNQYHFRTIQRPRTQHRNAYGPSKRTNNYVHREKIVGNLPQVRKGFSFKSQKDNEDLSIVPYFGKHGRLIPGHPELPTEARAQLPVLYIQTSKPRQEPVEYQIFYSPSVSKNAMENNTNHLRRRNAEPHPL